ncbi:ctaA Heme A synthase [Burkholderiales bacterium]|jgi:cytochrome c oxidase assembly protein subunit 15
MSEWVAPREARRFLVLALTTIAAVYFLILVGGTVRATGAGMGCPDWPLCFGQLIPPTSEAQLPANWREIYSHRGYADAPFDPIKTWTEYVNRLVGALIGLLVLTTAWLSRPYWQKDRSVVWAAWGGVFFVGFNGWLGSMVVATNLRPVMISLHMTGAFLVQMCLIYAVVRSQREALRETLHTLPRWFSSLVLATMAALILQIVMGIQIRESVDLISRAATPLERDQWIEMIPVIFYFHRSFSWVILGLVAYLVWKLWKSPLRSTPVGRISLWLFGLVVFEMLLGGALNHLGFPLLAQPVHLLAAHLIFGALWFLWVAISLARLSPAVKASSTPLHRTSHV